MVDCPRCGGTVERLRRLPADALEGGPAEADGDRAGEACWWCRREVIEG